jgi:hypothetical protein
MLCQHARFSLSCPLREGDLGRHHDSKNAGVEKVASSVAGRSEPPLQLQCHLVWGPEARLLKLCKTLNMRPPVSQGLALNAHGSIAPPMRPHSSISVAVTFVAAVDNIGNRQSSGTKTHKIRGSCRRVRLVILRHRAAPLKRVFSQSFPWTDGSGRARHM